VSFVSVLRSHSNTKIFFELIFELRTSFAANNVRKLEQTPSIDVPLDKRLPSSKIVNLAH